ncbi:MAG: UMP kinase [Bacteroidales bacterium]|nr:UMP kinase [Bacteroidales bacterium]MDD4209422.1 UMP kinase [Bacteroidales bacterium]
MMRYKRVLLKVSGASLAGKASYGISKDMLDYYAAEIKVITDMQVQLAVVIGGGNIFRGLQGSGKGFDRIQGDYMGMMATVINAMALQAQLHEVGVKAVILSSLPIESICEKMSSRLAIEYLEKGYVVLMSAGTGNPFFTTDTTGVLRALEIKADILLKGTRVDGVYDKDPEKNPKAVRYEGLTFQDAYNKDLNIMDLTAFTLCMENNLSIIVFDMNKKKNLQKVVMGENVGTKIFNMD